MPYVGQKPSNGRFIELDALTASATATYTLQYNSVNYAPESVHNLIVSINGVVQKPSSMSLSGSSLTVGATLSSSDTIDYVRVLGDVGSVVTPTDGSVTAAKIGTGAVTDAKLATSLDFQNITVKGGSTNAMTIDSSGRILTPARPCFSAYRNTTSGTYYDSGDLVFDATTVNVGSCYDTSNGRFTAPITGAYHLSCVIGSIYDDNSGSKFASNDWVMLQLRINGSGGLLVPKVSMSVSAAFEMGFTLSHVFQLTAGDYVIAHIRSNDTDSGDGGFAYNSSSGYMHYSGFLIG